ncbi:hypothetical protein [Staphylococcus saprophyticus]|uniref:hypothetical protein n=1 Tax=Staphylococcus saprophyticus TaxID=29385 RepID=UPI0034C62B3F
MYKNFALVSFSLLVVVSYFANYQLNDLGILLTMLLATVITVILELYKGYQQNNKGGGE